MFSSLMGPKASITLQPYQSVVFLHPPTEFEPSDAPKSQKLYGSLTLDLPQPREITSLVVKIVASYKVTIPQQQSESGLLEELASDLVIPKWLDKGEHAFFWSIEIPRSSAPQEECTFGYIRQRLQAVAETPNGMIKDDIELQLVVNPADEGDTMGINETIQGFHDAVGPYRATLTSGHLTVGGVIHYTLSFPSVPADLRLRSIQATFVQSFELTSRETGAHHVPTTQYCRLFVIDSRTQKTHITEPGSPGPKARRAKTVVHSRSVAPEGETLLGFALAGDGLELSHVARMPIDYLLRPSTHPGSNTPIRVTHKITMQVHFSTLSDSPPLVLRAERPVTISSCCCMLESLLLPSYSDALLQAAPSKHRRSRLYCPTECLCGLTLDHLLKKTHAPLLQAHEDAGNGEAPTPHVTLTANKIYHTDA